MPLWFYNLAIYCAQFAMLIAAGALMVAVTRLREPRLRLIYWQALLALGVLLPAIEPWQTAPKIEQGMAQAGVSAPHAGSIGVDSALAPPAHAAPSFSIYQIVAILLLAGLVYRLIWLTAGLIRLRRSRLCGHPLGPHAAVEQFKAAFNVSPAVIVSDRISSPVTFGWRTPKVMLPRKFTEMEDARQRAVLCHEFLHVRRRDWLWHVAEEILRSFFWFHLAVAWLIAQIRLCREQLVDREVVLLAGSRRDYLDALFEIASPSHYSRHAPALLFLSERHLKQRVKLILKEVTMSRKKLALALSASLGGLILTGVVAAALIPLRTSAAHASSEASVQAPAVRPDTHFYGNPNAKVTVVEFGDFQCPACREAASVAEQVRKDMGSEVRFAYRQFPLTKVHHQAEKAAEAAECSAQQGKFWQAVNYLSDHPLDFSNSGIRQFAASLGLDQAQTMQCLSSGSMAARVQQDIRDGRALGVRSVPTFLIGNTMVVGLQPYSRLHSLIEQKLRANGNAQSMTPSSSNMLSAASLEPTFAEGLNGQATGTPPQKARPAADPQPQSSQNTLTDMTKEHNAYINQAEIQRQIDEAMKQAKIAQGAASKIDQAKIQQQIDQAMKQAKIAQENFAKIDQAKIQHQVEEAMKKAEAAQEAVSKIDQAKIQQQVDEAMKQLQKVETPEMRRQYEKALKQFQKTNTPEMRRQYEEALKKLKMAQMTAPKIDQAKLRQQVEQAMEQAKIAQQDAAKVNKAEIQRKLDQLRKQAEQARKETEAARKEAEKARQDMMKARRQAEAQPKATKPAPSATPEPPPVPPTPASPSPDKVEPPAPPPASPQPPPVPPSSDKLMPPPNPLPASPAPPSPPQN